jgi:hypothetical protein
VSNINSAVAGVAGQSELLIERFGRQDIGCSGNCFERIGFAPIIDPRIKTLGIGSMDRGTDLVRFHGHRSDVAVYSTVLFGLSNELND